MNADTSKTTCYLVLGDASRQYALRPRPEVPLVVAELMTRAEGPAAVEYLSRGETRTDRIAVLSDDFTVQDIATPDQPVPIWDGVMLADEFCRLLPSGTAAGWTSDLAPIMVVRIPADDLVEVLMSTRVRAIGTTFTRVGRLPAAGASLSELVRAAFSVAPQFHGQVATEWQDSTRFEEETEIEVKFTLRSPVSIWGLASDLTTQVGGVELPGFIPDVGNELQRWEGALQLCEVLAPASQVGYVALQEQPTGHYLKYKVFDEDSLRRQETSVRLDTIPTDVLVELLAQRHPEYEVRALPSYTRTKFDVNVESSATGHFFGIEVDEVNLVDSDHQLRQLEIEYHRSRVHDGLDSSLIIPELMRLATLVESYLRRREITFDRTFYSKLSFLRDCVTDSAAV
ncbi:hypothetical protein [Kribbella catacumbae]|uniref:hypothetical protein n=1 Tax=Kribbella catacumbae TaxID=460086 RepID=UPI00035E6CFD|nr:hypothetical protein [Kribbella catacumbae]